MTWMEEKRSFNLKTETIDLAFGVLYCGPNLFSLEVKVDCSRCYPGRTDVSFVLFFFYPRVFCTTGSSTNSLECV